MRSAKFWAGRALIGLLCCAPLAFGQSSGQSQSVPVATTFHFSTAVLAFGFGPVGGMTHRSNNSPNGNWGGGGGGWGGGGGCGQGGQGGNGGWGGGGGGGGWGGGSGGQGGGGGCGVPEGGNSFAYLILAMLACIGAMIYRARRQTAVCETK
jgi:hypothetical protein